MSSKDDLRAALNKSQEDNQNLLMWLIIAIIIIIAITQFPG